MTDKNNRFLQGIVVAFIFHFLIAILLGLFEFHSNNYSPKILEITLGESGGGGGSGKKASSGEKASNTSEASSSKTNKDNRDIVTDKIVKQSVLIYELYKQIDTKKSSSSNNPVKNLDEQNLSNSTGETQGSAEQGDGEGQGSGSGEGSGSGSGNGAGKGEGNGDSTGNGSGNGAVTPPYLVSYTSPKYPPSIRNLEIEGDVYVKILVAADGKVKNVTLYKSSGNETLDSVAIKEVYQWRFRAAKDSYGNSMACNVILPVKFVLH